jgi:carboxypeptidase C (cathepsin A)
MLLAVLLLLSQTAAPQFPPSVADDGDIRTFTSPVNANITVQYKSPPLGTCVTLYPTQQQYTGYIHLPPFILDSIQQNYSINTFFWFIEARTAPELAPLTIYMNGGPGTSSMVALFQGVGPCEVIEIAKGKIGTQLRNYGWDRASNILFIDQPNQVGFSYDQPTNGSLNLLATSAASSPQFPPTKAPTTQPAYTYLNGTFSSNNVTNTANTTAIAAQAVWHMLQGFLRAFPQYNPGSRSNDPQAGVAGVHLFTESYGGKYGPEFAAFWEQQNALRRTGILPSNITLEIQLKSLGIINGCIDDLVQGIYYPRFAYNNTYDIRAVGLVDQQTAANEYLSADGCQQRVQACRDAVLAMDPLNKGDVKNVNDVCSEAQTDCYVNVIGPYLSSGKIVYDITQMNPSPFPSPMYLEYLNSADVQAAIGVPVNFSQTSWAVNSAFASTGDYERGTQVTQLAQLLSLGVRVALIYGDRDYICNWLGGEAVSFSVAAQSLPDYGPFYIAGYAPIVTNNETVGGVVRQYGNLSFSRIYNAGHLVPAYQPETAFQVFSRIIAGLDISLGEAVDLTTFGTVGDANATWRQPAPPSQKPTCYVRAVDDTCTNGQKMKLRAGTGVIINGVLYDKESDWKSPAPSGTAIGMPGTQIPAPSKSGSKGSGTTMSVPTGVYVATSTPAISSSKKGAAAGQIKASSVFYLLIALGTMKSLV